jgi:hypothetical protein
MYRLGPILAHWLSLSIVRLLCVGFESSLWVSLCLVLGFGSGKRNGERKRNSKGNGEREQTSDTAEVHRGLIGIAPN